MINRRAFLTGVLAAGLVAAWTDAEPDLSSKQAIDEAWDYLLDDPVAFYVEPGGALGLGLAEEPPPKTRSEAFDVPSSEIDSPSRMAGAADMIAPIGWELESALNDLRDEFLIEAEDWRTSRAQWCEATGRPEADYPSEALFELLLDLPEGADAGDMEEVLEMLPGDLFEGLRVHLAGWLAEEPDWMSEQDYFADWFQQRENALEYFNELGFSRDVLGELGVKIVEGEHPGSTYYAAELRLPLEEANARARRIGIPVLFVELKEVEPTRL